MPSNSQRQREYRARRKAAQEIRLDMTVSAEARDALRQIAAADNTTQRETLERILLDVARVVDRLERLARDRQESATHVFTRLVDQAEKYHAEKSRDARSFYGRRNQLLPSVENPPKGD